MKTKIRKGGEKTMLERLRNFNIDVVSIDEMVELLAFARIVVGEYANHSVDVPEWINSRMKEVTREINARRADTLEKNLRELKARREALKPAEVKRKEIDDAIAALEQKLA